MKESISKFITEGKALLWIKTNDFQDDREFKFIRK